MSLLTAVSAGSAESECVKLGSAAMVGAGLRDEDEDEDMFVFREDVEELEEAEEVLLVVLGAMAGGGDVYTPRGETGQRRGPKCARCGGNASVAGTKRACLSVWLMYGMYVWRGRGQAPCSAHKIHEVGTGLRLRPPTACPRAQGTQRTRRQVR